MDSRIPIFILTCDRLEVLKHSIESYWNYLDYPIDLVFIDNSTTYQPTLDFFSDAAKNGVAIFRYKQRAHHIDSVVPRINAVVDQWAKSNSFQYYIVTDPDIAFHERTPSDILDFYIELLNTIRMPNRAHTPWGNPYNKDWLPTEAVGPSLITDDVPRYYPKYKQVQASWGWINTDPPTSRRSVKLSHNQQDVVLTHHGIDTTFAIARRNWRYKRMMRSVLVGEPYNAHHLDWYLDPKNPTPDQVYYAHSPRCFTYYSNIFD
jgi:hypothetical protein